MKRRRHTPEEVIRKLRDAERLIGEGNAIREAAKDRHDTPHRWSPSVVARAVARTRPRGP